MTLNDYFPQTTCKISCGSKHGTGFLISKNQIITAAHTLTTCIDNHAAEITVIFHEHPEYSGKYNVMLISDLHNGSPIAVLQLPKDFDCIIKSLSADELTEDSVVKLYGYLSETDDYAEQIKFNVSRIVSSSGVEEFCNTVLSPIDERIKSFEGLSGSALIYDGKIVGMLLRQKSDSTSATRVEGVTGLKFREFLLEQGIELLVAQPKLTNMETEAVQRLTSIPGSVLTNEIDNLMSRQFEPIKQQRIDGKYVDSWTLLQEFIKQLPNSCCSLEKKADFYYSGALWALNDEYIDIAEEYILLAKKENPNIDTRTYQAKQLMNEGKFAKAREILQPLDSVTVYNLHLSCLLADKTHFLLVSDILSMLRSNNLEPDSQTHRLIAFVALNHDEYSIAYEHIDKAKTLSPNDAELKVYEALILYWEAMHTTFKNIPHTGFGCFTIKRFYPTLEQRQNLEKAYLLLEKAYAEKQSNINSKAQIVWGLVLLSALLPGKDPIRWLSYADEIDILIPSASIFRIDWNIKIPDGIYQKFTSDKVPEENVGLYAYALMEVCLAFEEYNKAQEIFEKYGEEISHEQGKSRDECKLRLLLDCKKYIQARELLGKLSLSENDKERYELIILLFCNPKITKSITRRALALAKKTHEIFDYLNADTICRKFKKWKEAAENAANWYMDTKLIYALECQANALLQNGNYPQALRVIKKAEDKTGDCSEQLKICKINCLIAASEFDDAIELTRTLDNEQSNPQLVVFQAQGYINSGQRDRALHILRSFADNGRFDFELYRLLVQLIKPDNPDLAYKYAYQLHLHEPENKDILKFAGMIGMQTGHSELAAQFYSLFQDGMPEDKNMRFVTVNEVMEIFRKERKSAEENAKLYEQSKMPIHCFTELFANKNLGGMLCAQWETTASIYARYGSKGYVDFNHQKSVILDYTACITILKLDIFEYVLELFDSVWITNNLLAIWLHDVNNLKDVQHHVVDRDIELSDELKKLSFDMQPWLTDDFEENNIPDMIYLRCAQENDAYIIAETPIGKTFGQTVPDDWYNLQIYPDELYAALETLKMPRPSYDAEKVRSGIVDQLLGKPRIVIDNHALLDLLEANALEMCFTYFSVFMSENIVYGIHFRAQEHLNRRRQAEWLENGYNAISNLLELRKIRICPIPQRRLLGMPESSIYLTMLTDEFLTAKNRGDNIWCDDRQFSRYDKVDGAKQNSGLFIGTLDVLHKMRECELLSESEYFQKLDKLFEANYCFFVPDADYLFSRISVAKCDDSGRLIENRQLTAVRRAFAIALHAEIGLNTAALQDAEHPEIAWYFLAASRVYGKCMLHIWGASKIDQWKYAASDWVLLTLGDVFDGYSNGVQNYLNQWTMRLYLLSTSSIRIDEKYSLQYSRWLNTYITTALVHNSASIDSVAAHISCLLTNAGERETNPADIEPELWEKLNLIVITRLLEKLPDILLERVVAQPTMRQYGIELERKMSINSLQSFKIVEPDDDKFHFEDILNCDEDAMENAILIVSSSPQKFGQWILNELSDERLRKTKQEMRYRLARFFFDLSWYLPCELCYQVLEKKRFLALIIER